MPPVVTRSGSAKLFANSRISHGKQSNYQSYLEGLSWLCLKLGQSFQRIRTEYTISQICYLAYRVAEEDKYSGQNPASEITTVAPQEETSAYESEADIPELPFENFPYDVKPFKARELASVLAESRQKKLLLAKKGKKLDWQTVITYDLWDEQRAKACLASDSLPRRCAMSAPLWWIWTELEAKNIRPTENEILTMLKIDATVSKFYPSWAVLQQRWATEKKAGKPLTPADTGLPPAAWFLDDLQNRSELEPLWLQLDNYFGN